MEISIARDGKTLGSFSLDVLKEMAAKGDIKLTDHAYIQERGEWKLIADTPELRDMLNFATLGGVIPPPPPPLGQVQVNQVPLEATGSVDALGNEDIIHGYPISYWNAYFGNKCSWYLSKFSGFTSKAEIRDARNEWREEDKRNGRSKFGLHACLRRQEFNNNIPWDAKLSPVGAIPIISFGWLAYRKIYFAVPMFLAFQEALGWLYCECVDCITKPHAGAGQIVKCLIAVLGWLVIAWAIPALFGLKMIYSKAQNVFQRVDLSGAELNRKIELIKKNKSVSIWHVCFFVVIAIATQFWDPLLDGRAESASNKIALMSQGLISDENDDTLLDKAWQATLLHVKSPSTAKIVSHDMFVLSAYEATVYQIDFDAQNSYGAMIRSHSLVLTFKDKATGGIDVDPNASITDDVDSASREIFFQCAIVAHENDLIPKTAK